MKFVTCHTKAIPMRYISILLHFLIGFNSYSQSTINGSFLFGGLLRSYSFYVPAIYDGTQAFPLVLNLHGYTSNGSEQSFYGNFKPIADTAGFIVVHPEGTIQPGTTSTQFWNVGFFGSNVDDVGFLTALIDTISAQYNIDPSRVYSTGMSNGGYMSLELACESGRFAAVASVTGSMTNVMTNSCNPAAPIPIMTIHGTADGTVPYNGNTSSISADSVIHFWVERNGCAPSPIVTPVPDIVSTDEATAEHYVYPTCQNGVTIEHFKILNGAHTWPGAGITIGTTCMDFSASKEIWRFFSQYSNPSANLGDIAASAFVNVYPNPFDRGFVIDSAEPLTLSDISLKDIKGKDVHFQMDGNKVNTDCLSPGIYFLNIKTENQIVQIKIIKNSIH
jgi:polyhydroxybutyrate depolymerase